eukprot:TRINITY_DN462_c0_g1_i1.p1 TRINITY_DN462_c0_g1~~TRINITY_DN462_c0_g1_i1.p1  ORF type:complete len:380 (-),score=49.32 TRINITY_DN462_c0_g1_i1:63-1160(-)
MNNRRRVVWFLLLCLVVFSSLAEGKRRKKWGRGICGFFQDSCTTVITSLADRKDLPRLVLHHGGTQWAAIERQYPDWARIDRIYRWPSASSHCSFLSDVLFASSTDCGQSAGWMFYVMTGYNLAKSDQGQALYENQQGLLVNIQGTWDAVIAGFRQAIAQNENRAFHFTEGGITKPFHRWVVLQTVKNGRSIFQVISAFANSYRVIDWLQKNPNLPVPDYANRQMTADELENIFVRHLEVIFRECHRDGRMNNLAKEAYRSLWRVEKWTDAIDSGKLLLRIAYAPATPDSCHTWKQNWMTQQGIPSGTAWNKAQTASNFGTRPDANDRMLEYLKTRYPQDVKPCEGDLDVLPEKLEEKDKKRRWL